MTARRLPEQFSLGGRVPRAVGLLLVLTLGLSLTVAFGDRHAGSLFEATALMPEAVWRGQIWRLVTWAFVEPDPIDLIFGCLFLYWFAGELAREWGSRRLLQLFGGIVLVASVTTCLVARVDPDVMQSIYLGGWATGAALTMAWGFWFPDRVIRIYFVIPIRGIVFAWLTPAITVILAVYHGWAHYLPVLSAEGAMFAWVFRDKLTARLRKARAGLGATRAAARQQAVKRERAKKRAQSVAYLRLIESHDEAPPDLPPEVDKKLDDILGDRSKRDRSMDN